jgi:hypothetical protein
MSKCIYIYIYILYICFVSPWGSEGNTLPSMKQTYIYIYIYVDVKYIFHISISVYIGGQNNATCMPLYIDFGRFGVGLGRFGC